MIAKSHSQEWLCYLIIPAANNYPLDGRSKQNGRPGIAGPAVSISGGIRFYCCGALPVVSVVDALESADTGPGVIELPTLTSRVR
jgi:hypothetical protein